MGSGRSSRIRITSLDTDVWWQSSPYNLRGLDVQTCIYNMELRSMADFMAKIYSDWALQHPPV
ncbi:hypothetical protein BKA82DRAFT_377505 [Pisolithus tinctorius]|uniref:Uncharacterized protein n=1 Tax=Pisolithus tinctorius Marx 270 TaxID=870435 RepID=A0A0C3P4H6_PISTI|nr:hypothetical protein BKA82DRAFT_377505 [Pisolithus tinctorius]KIO07945.1 hypothetical protein M404DRAFT_377505 [Pisolithus tinctorius Marx 270]